MENSCATDCIKNYCKKYKKAELNTVYFNDGVRRIDAILVYETQSKSEIRDEFLHNLTEKGLETETVLSISKDAVTFVKVHAPTQLLVNYAQYYEIPVKYKKQATLPEPNVRYKCMRNILNDPDPDPDDSIYNRARETISKQQPTDLTTAERSSLVFYMMQYIRFGNKPFDIGLSQLLLKDVISDAYPLHDGKYQWPDNDNDPLNDRQLLTRYWSNIENWNKQQPLNTIQKYFSNEIGMYFAWLGFYNKMLIIAAIAGVCCFLFGIVNEACNSDVQMCPYCKKCRSLQLHYYCNYFKYTYINDYTGSVVFALFMSFWSTIFMELWKRKYAKLNVRWNVNKDMSLPDRAEFQVSAKKLRLHKYTHHIQQYIPLNQRVRSFGLSISVVALMILVVLGTIFSVTLYECWLRMEHVPKIYITVSSSMLTLVVMIIFRQLYGQIAVWLTNQEIARTQLEYDKSYMIKMVIFSLANNYGKIFYVAFFKGKFFTYPGDLKMRNRYFPISAEKCDPTGCVFELFIFMVIVTLVNPLLSNIWEALFPMINIKLKKLKRDTTIFITSFTAWEQDYELNETRHFYVMDEFEEMVIQFGFVTLLAPAFPLAPLCALLNNIIEMRIDSNKMIKHFRRPVAEPLSSINVWFDTLHAMTYLAVITNAMFITFTSNFIPQLFYYHNHQGNLHGYVQFTLSEFQIVDSFWTATNITKCWYPGYRYPPGHVSEYEHTYTYFYMLSARFGFAISFVVVVLGVIGILSYAIPDMPQSLKDFTIYTARIERNTNT